MHSSASSPLYSTVFSWTLQWRACCLCTVIHFSLISIIQINIFRSKCDLRAVCWVLFTEYSNQCLLVCWYSSIRGVFPPSHISVRQPLISECATSGETFFCWLDLCIWCSTVGVIDTFAVWQPCNFATCCHLAGADSSEGVRSRGALTFMQKQPLFWTLRPFLALPGTAWHMLNWLRLSKQYMQAGRI